MYVTGYGEYAPCCVATKHTRRITPDEYWNSQELADIRDKLDAGIWPEDCGYCERKSKRGLRYEAERWNRNYEKNPVDTPTLLYLDYRPSNTCNLKCRMCVPNLSSLINSEAREYMDEYQGFRSRRTLIARDFDEFLQFVKNNELEEIKVLGGEPTIDPLAIQALEAVQCKNLKITTNATNLNRQFRRILKKFEHVHMTFSLDATDATYEYIRTNANWRKVSDRIAQIMQEDVANSYGFNVVCQPYNIFNLPQLEAWFDSLPGKFEVNWDDSDVEYTSLSAVLPEHIEWCLQHVQDPDLRKILQATEFDSENHRKFCDYAAMLDEIRRTQLIDLDERFTSYV
jgi:organic radical activating enzyme